MNTSDEVNKFKTVKIGNQVWMAENLNVGKFRNGDPIFEANCDLELEDYEEENIPAWSYYYDREALGKVYGRLYN